MRKLTRSVNGLCELVWLGKKFVNRACVENLNLVWIDAFRSRCVGEQYSEVPTQTVSFSTQNWPRKVGARLLMLS